MILTADELAIEITMRCGNEKGPFILVEGDDDVLFLQCHTTINIENIIPTSGWERLVEAVKILQRNGILNVLGIIDLDYRGIIASNNLPNSVFTTDTHDIETMMINSPAFIKVLSQKSSKEKIRKYPKGVIGVKRTIFELGKHIGCLRFYSQQYKRNYSFNGLDISKFIDRCSLTISTKTLISHLRGIHENNKSISDDVIILSVEELTKHSELKDPCLLCCGHDLMEIMAIGLKSVWGSYSSREISGSLIEESFRLAYSIEMFSKTNLHKSIEGWFQENGFDSPWAY